MRYIIIIAFMVFSCVEKEPIFLIQPELKTYYKSFVQEAHKRGIVILDENLIMTIEEGMVEKYGGYGVTRQTSNQTYIYIDKKHFDRRGELIEMTVLHELGHAKLNRQHNESSISLMNPSVSQGQWPICSGGYVCKDVLIDELFKQ